LIPTGRKILEDRAEVVFQEEHSRDDNIGGGDVGANASQGQITVGPIGRGMHRDHEAWNVADQIGAGAFEST
jgi:hypothetical protein